MKMECPHQVRVSFASGLEVIRLPNPQQKQRLLVKGVKVGGGRSRAIGGGALATDHQLHAAGAALCTATTCVPSTTLRKKRLRRCNTNEHTFKDVRRIHLDHQYTTATSHLDHQRATATCQAVVLSKVQSNRRDGLNGILTALANQSLANQSRPPEARWCL